MWLEMKMGFIVNNVYNTYQKCNFYLVFLLAEVYFRINLILYTKLKIHFKKSKSVFRTLSKIHYGAFFAKMFKDQIGREMDFPSLSIEKKTFIQ